ncbi:hypothetical protein [Flavobacterium undicola]|uniref:hypothetical protein n=1 Tax=Flavobacterium undicola TaxID=1932779 RepID=UPI0013780D7A|nr:hypothetical protein [Flavobacterium undicola]MBA0884133.1 hypothetical protein [Flavobacterium undicola]
MKKHITFMAFIVLFFALQGFLTLDTVLVTGWSTVWKIDTKSIGKITFMEPQKINPLIPPQPHGLKFHLTKDDFLPVEKVYKTFKIRLTTYNGTLLKDITELKYWTFTKDVVNKNVPFVVLQFEYTSLNPYVKGKKKFKLIYVPPHMKIIPNKWQEWDLRKGVWALYNDVDPPSEYNTLLS